MEQRNYCLYLHITPNGKRYYGITKQTLSQRWRNGKGYKNQMFYNAINKYGWDNIEHIILFDSLTESEAKELEQYFIQWYDTANPQYGYNISLGGDGSNHSEETKQKISKSNQGKHHSEESKRKISEGHKGIKHSEKTKKKQSKANTGINNSMYGKTGINCPASKPIICISTNRIFTTVKAGANYYNIDSTSISKCCKGKLKSAGKLNGQKLVWRYLNHKHNKRYRIKNELGEPLVM